MTDESTITALQAEVAAQGERLDALENAVFGQLEPQTVEIRNIQLHSNDLTVGEVVEATDSLPEVSEDAELVFVADFESGEIQAAEVSPDGLAIQPSPSQDGLANDYKAKVVGAGDDWHGAIVPTPYAGTKCVALYLNRADWDGTNRPIPEDVKPRSQLTKSNRFLPILQGVDWWIGGALYIPKDLFDEETEANNEGVRLQLHGSGDFANKSPPLSLVQTNNGLQWKVITGDTKSPPLINSYEWTQNPIITDAWMPFAIYIRPSATDTGQLEIWHGDEKVVERLDQPNCYTMGNPASTDPLYFCLNVYNAKLVSQPSSVNKAGIYFDEIRIARGKNARRLVDPRYASVPN